VRLRFGLTVGDSEAGVIRGCEHARDVRRVLGAEGEGGNNRRGW